MDHSAHDLLLKTDIDTQRLAQCLAPSAKPGTVFLLSGDLGAGKSTFARSFIRHFLGQSAEVPSPTFTLVQVYETADFDIWHCDLYRLSSPFEAIELGLDDAFEDAVCLIEWPERLGDYQPNDAIHIRFDPSGEGRMVRITGNLTGLTDLATFNG